MKHWYYSQCKAFAALWQLWMNDILLLLIWACWNDFQHTVASNMTRDVKYCLESRIASARCFKVFFNWNPSAEWKTKKLAHTWKIIVWKQAFARLCKSFAKFAKVSKFCKVCKLSQNYAKSCKVLQKVCKALQTLANFCNLLQTFCKTLQLFA